MTMILQLQYFRGSWQYIVSKLNVHLGLEVTHY